MKLGTIIFGYWDGKDKKNISKTKSESCSIPCVLFDREHLKFFCTIEEWNDSNV